MKHCGYSSAGADRNSEGNWVRRHNATIDIARAYTHTLLENCFRRPDSVTITRITEPIRESSFVGFACLAFFFHSTFVYVCLNLIFDANSSENSNSIAIDLYTRSQSQRGTCTFPPHSYTKILNSSFLFSRLLLVLLLQLLLLLLLLFSISLFDEKQKNTWRLIDFNRFIAYIINLSSSFYHHRPPSFYIPFISATSLYTVVWQTRYEWTHQ